MIYCHRYWIVWHLEIEISLLWFIEHLLNSFLMHSINRQIKCSTIENTASFDWQLTAKIHWKKTEFYSQLKIYHIFHAFFSSLNLLRIPSIVDECYFWIRCLIRIEVKPIYDQIVCVRDRKQFSKGTNVLQWYLPKPPVINQTVCHLIINKFSPRRYRCRFHSSFNKIFALLFIGNGVCVYLCVCKPWFLSTVSRFIGWIWNLNFKLILKPIFVCHIYMHLAIGIEIEISTAVKWNASINLDGIYFVSISEWTLQFSIKWQQRFIAIHVNRRRQP